jgi:diguanylate cyclase (GGDEF)-like protein/putative nucleotidyltransferase with HDIG domain
MPDALRPAATLVDQARRAQSRGEHELARELLERALREAPRDTPSDVVFSLLVGIARASLDLGDSAAAFDGVDLALAVADAAEAPTARAEALALRARLHTLRGAPDDAEADLAAARPLAEGAGAHILGASITAAMADLAFARSDRNEAVRLLEESRDTYAAAKDRRALARISTELGALYDELERWNLAEQAFADALRHAAASNDDGLTIDIELARAEMAIARGNLERAHASSERALTLARQRESESDQAAALAVAGAVARALGDLPRAERHLEQGERLATDLDQPLRLAEIALERALLLAVQERHHETLLALNRAYRLLAQLRGSPNEHSHRRRIARLERGFIAAVRQWAIAIESKDQATAGHLDRVADLTVAMARRLGVEETLLYWYRVGALLHDVGKMSIPASVLNKAGRLTAEEWALVKRHPITGAELLAEVDFPWEVRPIVESHHECWDGSGYPRGLAGGEIPLAARIFCVADVFDALTSRRSFKRALSRDEALDIMRRDVGRQFDPAVFRVFEDVVREGAALAAPLTPSEQRSRSTPVPMVDDELTGVAQRGAFLAQLASTLGERRGAGDTVALLVVDVDDFRRVTDTFGRLQGDDVLWAVAKVLQRGIRTGDLVGRLETDEFAVLLPATSIDVATDVAERLRAATAQLRCVRRDSSEDTLAVTVSVGVACAPQHGETADALLAAAERATFEAKRLGRDRVTLADDGTQVAERAQLRLDHFIDRDDEIRRLVAYLEEANHLQPRIVSVVGEAGIGKSALVRQLEPEVRLRGGHMVTAQCSDGEVRAPFAPWIDIVQQLHALGVVHAHGWRALAQLVPTLDGGASLASSTEASTTNVLHELVDYVRLAARRQPLVVVLEDMQWGDTASWDAVEEIVAHLTTERILLILTLRSSEAQGVADRRRRLARDPRASQLALQRFSLAQLTRWVETLFHDGDLGTDFPAFLHDYTEGIPLYVIHVLQTLRDEGGIWYAGTRWEWRPLDELSLPPAIGQVLERRLDRLSPRARNVLAAAAVLGPSFSLDLVMAAGAGSDADVRAAIDEGLGATVIEQSGDPRQGRYAFTHALIADACRRTIPERQRQRLHEVAARTLELRAPAAVADIAAHYHAAGNDVQAFRYASLAADRAASVDAHDEAAAFLTVAQRHAPNPSDLTDVRIRLAGIAMHSGRYEYAEEMCDLALEWLAANADQRREIAVRRLREEVRVARGRPPQRAIDDLTPLAERVHTAAGPADASALFATLADFHAALAAWPAAETAALQAVESAYAAHDTAVTARASLALGVARVASAGAEAFALFRDAQSIFAHHGDRRSQSRCALEQGVAHLRSGYLTEARADLAKESDLGRAAHSAVSCAESALRTAELHIRVGDIAAAREYLEEAKRLYASVRDQPRRTIAQFTDGQLLREGGELPAAASTFEQVVIEARELGRPWLEAAALAAAALVRLHLRHAGAEGYAERANEIVAQFADDRWFAGREFLDALNIRLALSGGHAGLAIETFNGAAEALERRDVYAACWLAAETAPLLLADGITAVQATVAHLRRRAQRHGFTRVAARYPR